MRYHAISTFNAAGFDLYGRRMIHTFDQFWPEEVALTIYSEDWEIGLERADVLDLEAVSPWLTAFKRRHRDRPVRSYRFDAVRFAHKVAAVCHAARQAQADFLIWIDGDVFTHAPVTMTDLESWLPGFDDALSWLYRDKMYPECGFYILNCQHRSHEELIEGLEVMYADDGLFDLKEWHDSYVLEQVVAKLGLSAKSLSGHASGHSHPIERGPLGAFIEHAKGPRKHRQRG